MHMPQTTKTPWVRTLFDTYDERHAFIIGFGEILPPWPPRVKINPALKSILIPEYHYYMAGRTCGFIAILGILKLAKKLLWG